MQTTEQTVIFLCILGALLVQRVSCAEDYTYNVVCNHATPTCECPLEDNGQRVDVCTFNLVIEVLQTFTRYNVDPDTNTYSVPHGGRVWYIDETTGEYKPFPDARDVCNSSIPISDTRCTSPNAVDSYTFKNFIAINSRIPGPMLVVHENQAVKVTVVNDLIVDVVTIHWHGMDQQGNNWEDGVESITQCGISPGTNYTYSFIATPSGTHWYHSHTGNQRNRGLYGSLIVLEDESVLNVVREKLGHFNDTPNAHTLLISEWQNQEPNDIFVLSSGNTRYYNMRDAPDPLTTPIPQDSLTTDGTEAGSTPFWSLLINGHGRHHTISYIASRLSVFTVSPSNVHRLRFIGGQHVFALRVSIDEHSMVVVATDGAFMEPVEVDYLILGTGERYDVLLHTKNFSDLNGKSDFVIRVETLEVFPPKNSYEVLQLRQDHLVEAILHYDISDPPSSAQYSDIIDNSVPVDTMCVGDNPCVALNCPFKDFPPSYNITCVPVHKLQMLLPPSVAELPSVDYDEQLLFNFGYDGLSGTNSVNARSMVLPSSPLTLLGKDKLEALAEREFCHDLADSTACDTSHNLATTCFCTHVKQIPFNKSIQIVLSAVTPDPQQNFTHKSAHSIHLHGHHFHVVDLQFGTYDESSGHLVSSNADIVCGGMNQCTVPGWREGRDYAANRTGKIPSRAPRKDTLVLPPGAYAVIYLQSNNPGYWYIHDVSEARHLSGMGAVIAEGVEHLQVPQNLTKQCGDFIWSADEYFGDTSNRKVPACLPKGVLYGLSVVVVVVLAVTVVCLVPPGLIACFKVKVHSMRSTAKPLAMKYKKMENVIDDDTCAMVDDTQDTCAMVDDDTQDTCTMVDDDESVQQ